MTDHLPDAFDRYYIRLRGRVQGPFDKARLQSLRSRGLFSRACEVSQDGLNWEPAANVPDMFIDASGDRRGAPLIYDPLPETHADAPTDQRPPQMTGRASPADTERWRLPSKRSVITAVVLVVLVGGGLTPLIMLSRDAASSDDGPNEAGKANPSAPLDKVPLDTVLYGDMPHVDEATPSPAGSMVPEQPADAATGGAASSAETSQRPTPAGDKQPDSEIPAGGPLSTSSGQVLPTQTGTAVPVVHAIDPLLSPPDLLPGSEADTRQKPTLITSIGQPGDDAALSAAVGLVVLGLKATLTNGRTKELPAGTGSCFLVTLTGAAITNRHVVEDTWQLSQSPEGLERLRLECSRQLGLQIRSVEPRVWTFFNGVRHEATVTHVSDNFDLAVLMVQRIDDAPVFSLSASDELPRGRDVYALGYPGAANAFVSEEEHFQEIFSQSVLLRSPGRNVAVESLLEPNSLEFTLSRGIVGRLLNENSELHTIQHTAGISPGSSGGPLVTTDGTVHGINTAVVRETAGISFSVMVGQMRREIDREARGVTWK